MSRVARIFLYVWLFSFAVILLGLTGYRVHYTETLNPPGDILTSSTHFYDPVIVELLVTSALAILLSIWLVIALLARVGRGPMASYLSEAICLTIVWIMFLVGAAIATSKWNSLRWCRSRKVCSVLRTILAFSWMCWVIAISIWIICLVKMADRGLKAPFHGRRDDAGAYPETRETPTTGTGGPTGATAATTTTQPVGQPQPVIA